MRKIFLFSILDSLQAVISYNNIIIHYFLSLLVSLAQSRGIVSHEFIEAEIMREIALLGLSILIFYNTSGMLLDPKRSTAIDSFKTSLWMSIVSFAGI
ncbi:hypothetical protein HRED_11045, partial [Candidatus Haloredivivus sp. G17]